MGNLGYPSPPTKRNRRWVLWILAVTLPVGLFALFVFTVRVGLRAGGVRAYVISSAAMAPTLEAGDRVFVNNFAYASGMPDRGDVVTFVREGTAGTVWVKRVIAIGGDVIEGSGDQITLNGQVLHEPYLTPIDSSEPVPDPFGPVTVPAGSFFVMGDNRHHSNDSRYFGFIDAKNVRGKVAYIYWSKDAVRNWTRVH
jgi:signal peptidase I